MGAIYVSEGCSFLIILKKINNNFALALDAAGAEVIVYGSGVGFPKTPYNLEDDSVIDRVYREIDGGMVSAMVALPEDILSLAAEFADAASRELRGKLSDNLAFTLADHIQFAIERAREGLYVESPLDFSVSMVYPDEYRLGEQFVARITEITGTPLPATETSLIALHLVSAEAENRPRSEALDEVFHAARVINRIMETIQLRLELTLDIDSYECRRFTSHLRYLIKRCTQLFEQEGSGAHTVQEVSEGSLVRSKDLLHHLKLNSAREYSCARAICAILREEYGWRLGSDELLYLLIYITRLVDTTL